MKDIEVVFEEGSRGTKGAIEQAQKLLSEIPKGYEKATARALNRAATAGRAAAVSTIRQTYTVKASTIRDKFSISRANFGNLEAIVAAKGPVIPLGSFRVKPATDTTGARRANVRVSVKKGGAKSLGNSFVYKGKVLHRIGAARLPVNALYGPSVAGMTDNEKVRENIDKAMRETFLTRLDHETRYLLEKE